MLQMQGFHPKGEYNAWKICWNYQEYQF